jgi:hypothetical protein
MAATFRRTNCRAGRTQLRTLREAIKYLAETVPQGARDMPAIATAVEMLTYAAERETAWMMFARIGVMRGLNRHVERKFNPDRKDTHWGRRKLTRDR